MDEINSKLNQVFNICYWINSNTNINCDYFYSGEDSTLHVSLKQDGEIVYSHNVEKISLKNNNILILEINRLIDFLLIIKFEKDDL